MSVSAKQREYIHNHGKTKSVSQLARELGLARIEVRRVLRELQKKKRLKDDMPETHPSLSDTRRAFSKSDYLWAALPALASLVVYLLTAAPDVTGEDSGELVTAAYTLGVCHPPGYPLWCLLGKLFTILVPVGTVAYRINFMSAFFAAGTVYFLFLVIRKVAGSRVIAVSCALVFAFSYEFWSQSTIAEVYALNAFLVSASLFFLLLWEEKRSNRSLYSLAFLCGLGCTNHQTMAIISLIIASYVLLKARKPRLRLKVVGISLALFLAALSLYLYLPLRARANPYMNWGNPTALTASLDHILRRQYEVPEAEKEKSAEYQRSWKRLARQTGVYCSQYIRQFTYLLFWLPLLGICIHFRRRRLEFYALLSIFLFTSVGFLLFANFKTTREGIIANDFLFIPSYLVATIWLGLGLAYLWKAATRKSNRQIVRVCAAALVLSLPGINLFGNYYENDKSRYYFALDYGNALLDTMDKNAIILPRGDHRIFPLLYLQGVQGVRPDVTIANKYGHIEESLYQNLLAEKRKAGKSIERIPLREKENYIILNNQDRPIYFTERRVMAELAGLSLVPVGLLFKVIPQTELPKYGANFSEQYWKSYVFRNFGDTHVARDYTADMILVDYHYMRAQSYFHEGKAKQAIEEIEKLKKPAEGFQEVFNNVGNMLAERGFLKEAIPFYEKALYYDPDFLTAIQNMAKAYLLLRDYENCTKYLNRALQIKPGDFETHTLFAQMLITKGDFDGAIVKLESIIAHFPRHHIPYRVLGSIYLEQKKDLRKAVELFQKSLELNPNQPDLNALLQQLKDQ